MHGICTLAANRTILSLRISLLLFALIRCHATSGELASTVIANYLDYWQNSGNEIYILPHSLYTDLMCPENAALIPGTTTCIDKVSFFFYRHIRASLVCYFLRSCWFSLYFCRGKFAQTTIFVPFWNVLRHA